MVILALSYDATYCLSNIRWILVSLILWVLLIQEIKQKLSENKN
jgi:uncharacterized transporter YbjL